MAFISPLDESNDNFIKRFYYKLKIHYSLNNLLP